MARGRDGSFLTRSWREVTGGSVDGEHRAGAHLQRPRGRPAAGPRARAASTSPPRTRASTFTGSSVAPVAVAERPQAQGDARCTARSAPRSSQPGADRTFVARTRTREAEGHDRRARPQVPDAHHRRPRRLPAHAVQEPASRSRPTRSPSGRSASRRPAGLYTIQNKQVNPTWNVPDSEWAGDLAGKSIPPGPDEPAQGALDGHLRRRRHPRHRATTARSAPPPRTAASAWPSPTSIDLYDRVAVGTPVYIA